ncbi:MAG TPA: dynamin family protein [Thermoplasmata archaeon]|nr:dynamin family protein [Thermoplasmata archaeon]
MSPSADRAIARPAPGPLAELEQLAEDAGQPELAREIRSTAQELAHGRLTVAVLGQFKRGKSSLLNAFAGCVALPTGVLPTTSVPTALVRGPGEARVTDADGAVRRVPLAKVVEFVSEQRNPGNRRGIARVEVAVPLDAWTDGVTFLDSPGIGSASDLNTRAAHELLPRVDAAIFVLSPDPPITAEEVAFLTEVRPHATKFFFVVNKIDLLGPEERRELLGYVETIVRERCGFSSVRLFCTSARAPVAPGAGGATRGEGTGVPELWHALREFLGPGRSRALDQVAGRRVRQYAARLGALTELALRSSRLDAEERAGRLVRLERGIEDLRAEHRASQALVAEEIQSLERELPDRITAARAPRVAPLVASLSREVPELPGRTAGGLVAAFDRAFRARVLPVVGEIRAAASDEVTRRLADIGEAFERRLRRWSNDLHVLVATEFSIDLPPTSVEVKLAASDRYTDRIDGLFEGTFAGQTVLFLPAAVLRRRLVQQVPALVERELEAQSGRIRSDLFERVERSWSTARTETAERLDRELRLLGQAVGAGRAAHDLGQARLARWQERMEGLEARAGALAEAAGPAA